MLVKATILPGAAVSDAFEMLHYLVLFKKAEEHALFVNESMVYMMTFIKTKLDVFA